MRVTEKSLDSSWLARAGRSCRAARLRRSIPWLASLATGALVFACTTAPPVYEADAPGECSDHADNDLDGLFDCDDPDCFGAPACAAADVLGPCRPVDHLWDPATEPMRLPCEPTYEECNGIDDDFDGFLDPKCGTESCTDSVDCTHGGLMPDADCNQNSAAGPVCTWIDGVPPVESILDCRGMLCPPGLKCVQGDCLVPGDGPPLSSCTSGADCAINSGCLSPVEEGTVGYCVWFCHDFPCPDGFVCSTSSFENPHTGTVVTQQTCDYENPGSSNDPGEGNGPGCTTTDCPDCADSVDNDADGLIDCDDPGCIDFCGAEGNGEDCTAADCPECSDLADNDADGFIDCDDPGCVAYCGPEGSGPGCTEFVCPSCEDKIDNDGDGLIDCDDPGCDDNCP